MHGPLAHRLGVHHLRNELETAAFRRLFPEQFHEVRGGGDERVGGENKMRGKEGKGGGGGDRTKYASKYTDVREENVPKDVLGTIPRSERDNATAGVLCRVKYIIRGSWERGRGIEEGGGNYREWIYVSDRDQDREGWRQGGQVPRRSTYHARTQTPLGDAETAAFHIFLPADTLDDAGSVDCIRKGGGGITIKSKLIAHPRMCLFVFHNSIFQLLDKPWSQVSSLSSPNSCLHFLSRIGFSNPTARRFFIECC